MDVTPNRNDTPTKHITPTLSASSDTSSHKRNKRLIRHIKEENSALAKLSKNSIHNDKTSNNTGIVSIEKRKNETSHTHDTKDNNILNSSIQFNLMDDITMDSKMQEVKVDDGILVEDNIVSETINNLLSDFKLFDNNKSSLNEVVQSDLKMQSDLKVMKVIQPQTNYNSTSYLNIISKPPKFCKIGNESIINAIHKYETNTKPLLDHYSKMVLNNFGVVYKSKSSTSTHLPTQTRAYTIQNTSTKYKSSKRVDDPYQFNFQHFCCCLLEDYMLLQKNEKVIVLVPTENKCIDLCNWNYLINEGANSFVGELQIQAKIYYVFEGTIEMSPSLHIIQAGGVSDCDLKHIFGHANSGCNIFFELDNIRSSISILVTFTHVLNGRSDGYQVWSKRSTFRNLSKNFTDHQKTEEGLLSFLNNVYHEIYGDTLQVASSLSIYY